MVADTFVRRFCGLQFKRGLEQGSGLLLVPCGSIHTFWMRFPIDVLFLSDSGRVVEIRQDVCPWCGAVCKKKPHAVLEIASGASNDNFQVGDTLQLVRDESRHGPTSLDFLESEPTR